MSSAASSATADTSAARGEKTGDGVVHLVGIGGLVTAQTPDKLRSVLGSCVGIALFDPVRQIAGLAHSILPEGSEEAAELGKFADQAVDNLIVTLTSEGADKTRLQAKLIGGATMFGAQSTSDLGKRNVEVAAQRLGCHNIPVVGQAVGGGKGRRMILDPANGEVIVEIIGEAPMRL